MFLYITVRNYYMKINNSTRTQSIILIDYQVDPLDLPLIAVHQLQFGHLAQIFRLLVLNEAARVHDELALAVEAHHADHLLPIVPHGPTLIDEGLQILGIGLTFGMEVPQLALQEVPMHQHHLRVEHVALHLKLLPGYCFALINR